MKRIKSTQERNTPTFFIKKIDLQGNILCIQKKNEKANFAT